MKFRNLLMTAALLLAVSASFASKAKRNGGGIAFYLSGSSCLIGNTEQNTCSKDFTGPVCTISSTDPSGHSPAYYYGSMALPCVALLHQF